MNNDLFPPPAHELLADRLHAEHQAALRAFAAQQLRAVNDRLDLAQAFKNRSVAQRRRFLRYRQLTGVTA